MCRDVEGGATERHIHGAWAIARRGGRRGTHRDDVEQASTGYQHAKEQLWREVDDVNPDPALARLEARIALAELLSRMVDYDIDDAGARRVHSVNVRGFASLPTTVEVR
jgi:hypothetical protein